MSKIIEKRTRGSIVEFKLLNKFNKKSDVIKVDKEDFDFFIKNKTHWYAKVDTRTKRYYVAKNINQKTIQLHNCIMKFKPSRNLVIDHINNNSLDNRKFNLQILSIGENVSKEGTNGPKPKIVYKGLTITVITTIKRFQCYDGDKYVGSSLCINKMKSKIDKYLEDK